MPDYPLTRLVDARDWDRLFIEELGWSRSRRQPLSVTVIDHTYRTKEIAQFKGIGIWLCESRPDEEAQRYIEARISGISTDHLVIFADDTRQDWRWPRRRQLGGVNAKLINHPWIINGANQDRQAFESRLRAIELPFDEDLLVTDVLTRLRAAFDKETQTASSKAAALMGRLYEMVRPDGAPTEAETEELERSATQLLARLLFLFFADDTGVWASNAGHPDEGRDLFLTWVRQETTPDNFTVRLEQLFDALSSESSTSREEFRDLQRFPVVAGAIFAEHLNLPNLSEGFRRAVIEAGAEFDWSIVSPAIFGSMFQTVKSAEARRSLGEHYTTEENIQKLIGPLFMDDLRAKLARVDELDTDRKKINALNKLLGELADIRILDPACGCGNFLIVSYRDLRTLELEVLEMLQRLDAQRKQTTVFADELIGVRLEHFSGIEIEEWPARIATTALYLARHLANMRMQDVLGIAPQTLPLHDNDSIHCADALNFDWDDSIERTDHNYVIGNPPFLGHARRSKAQKAQLKRAWGERKQISRLDFVTAWHAKSLDLMKNRSGKWGFVTTNSITQGDQTARLFGPIFDAGWRIKFAHRTFAWSSEAPGEAGVHCVVIGFTRDVHDVPRLWDYATPTSPAIELQVRVGINAYLIDGPNVLVEKRSHPLSRELKMPAFGSMPRDDGNLIVEPDEYAKVAADPIAATYLLPYVGSRELIHGNQRWCLWLEGLTQHELEDSEVLLRRVDAVAEFRAKSDAKSTRDYPYPHLFVQMAKQDVDYVCIPSVVSESRPFFTVALLPPDIIASNATFELPDPSGLQFALLSSSMFIVWQKAIGGRLESRVRFSSTVAWSNFPVPDFDEATRTALIEAGKGVLAARDPKRSLAEQYGPHMTKQLTEAHEHLDTVMDQAMGATHPLSTDAERLAVLFENYARMIGN